MTQGIDVVTIAKLCELARDAGYEEDRWDEIGHFLESGRLLFGRLSLPEETIKSLREIIAGITEDPEFDGLSPEQIGELMLWIDVNESEAVDPADILFVYITPEKLAEMERSQLH